MEEFIDGDEWRLRRRRHGLARRNRDAFREEVRRKQREGEYLYRGLERSWGLSATNPEPLLGPSTSLILKGDLFGIDTYLDDTTLVAAEAVDVSQAKNTVVECLADVIEEIAVEKDEIPIESESHAAGWDPVSHHSKLDVKSGNKRWCGMNCACCRSDRGGLLGCKFCSFTRLQRAGRSSDAMSTPSKKAGSPKPIMFTRNWTARRAHAGEDYTSNKDAAREAFLKRRPELAVAEQLREVERAAMKAKRSGSKKQKTKFSGTELDEAIARLTLLAETQTVESLREKMVTQPLERAGFQIRDDKKSTAKHADGRANVIMTSGGIECNVSDMRRPTASLPADKAKRILDDLNEFLGQESKKYDFASFRSLTFRLQDAMKVVPRGKIHTNGMYRALRGKDEGDLVAGSN